MAEVSIIKEWSGAIATGFAAIVGFLGVWIVPSWAKKHEIERTDQALVLEADVKSREDLYNAFSRHIDSLHKRCDQLTAQFDESVADREKLWEARRALLDELEKEKELGRKRDKALLDCEIRSSECDKMLAIQKDANIQQSLLNEQLKKSVVELEEKLTAANIRLDIITLSTNNTAIK